MSDLYPLLARHRSIWTQVTATPSGVTFNVRVEPPNHTTLSDAAWWLNEVADAIDCFVYELCEVCGYDLDGHVVVPGPFGHPYLYCENGEGS